MKEHLKFERKLFLENRMGFLYYMMGEYSKVLSFDQKTLPLNFPLLAASYSNIGCAFERIANCLKALSLYECTRDIWSCALPSNDPYVFSVQECIGILRKKL